RLTMDVLIIGCGWVGTFTATSLIKEGHRVWATTTTVDKESELAKIGATPMTVDFDNPVLQTVPDELVDRPFDLCLISVPITRKDSIDQVRSRFAKLVDFLAPLSWEQLTFLGSVGIYPKVSAEIEEDTF